MIRELVARIDARHSIEGADMSMGDWICKNTRLRSRPFSFDRYPFQKAIADDMHPNMDVIKPSQVGLALALDTPVPTPEGWSTMGELKVGDLVFDDQGEPTEATYVSPIYKDHQCFELEFDKGEKIVADAGHRWFVQGYKAFNGKDLCFQTGRFKPGSDWMREGVITTEMLFRNHKYKGRNVFAIPNAKPLKTVSRELPLDPYVLGIWLGDGSSASASLTCHQDDYPHLKAAIEPWGYSLSPLNGYQTRILFNDEVHRHRDGEFDPDTAKVYARLSELDLIRNKHIPPQYLRATEQHRRDLLQGLLDTDGSITKNGRVSFYNCNPLLVKGVEEILHSLGLKPHTRWKKPSLGTLKNGHEINSKQMIAEVSCMAYAEDDLFRLPRKASRLKPNGRSSETYRRRITSVTPVRSQPVRCISVSSPSHLFLCGRGMIPTHNTEVQVRKALAFVTRNRGTNLIFTLPTDDMYERMSATRILPLAKEEPVFNLGEDKPIRSKGLIQVGQSFMFVTGAKEGDATSISADAVFNDEIDLTDQSMLALFNSRLQNSDWKISQRFSTPTFHGFGIDAGYQLSDQHEFMCQCDSCNHWNIPTFNESFIDLPGLPSDMALTEIDTALIDSGRINVMDATVVCEKCRSPLDLGRWEKREWIARKQSRTHHRGYRVRPFSTDRLAPSYIIGQMLQYRARDYMRGWYNTVLGEAYNAGSARLSEAELNQCFTAQSQIPTPDPSKPSWIGIDVGKTCHLILSQGDSLENQHVVMFKAIPVDQLFDEVEVLLSQYNVVGGACDRHPYTPTADELYSVSKGKIIPVEYRGEKTLNFVKDPITEKITHGQVNRTTMIDACVKMIRKGYTHFSGYGNQKSLIIDHFRDMVRDETPDKPARWVKLTGNDHYFHAAVFLTIALRMQDMLNGMNNESRSAAIIGGADFGVPTEDLRLGQGKRPQNFLSNPFGM